MLLGYVLFDWDGTGMDEREEVHWLHKAAESNFKLACEQLGWCYQYGVGVQRNDDKANKWNELAQPEPVGKF